MKKTTSKKLNIEANKKATRRLKTRLKNVKRKRNSNQCQQSKLVKARRDF